MIITTHTGGIKIKIIVIGAHPDDYELGMAGAILKHVNNGDEVYGIVATNGAMLLDRKAKKNVRVEEAKKSAKALGIKKMFYLGLKDTQVSSSHKTIKLIEEIVKKIRPQRIYTHSLNDTHQDHHNLSKAVIVGARKIKQVLFYESPSSDNKFSPTYFIELSEEALNQKVEVMKLHKSLLNLKRRYLEIGAIKAGASFRGYQVNLNYAEGFEVFRYVEEVD
jgi:LmbE family N-acetylglucosaminyl deacetylase